MINNHTFFIKKMPFSPTRIAMALLLTLVSGCNRSIEPTQVETESSENKTQVAKPATDPTHVQEQTEQSADLAIQRLEYRHALDGQLLAPTLVAPAPNTLQTRKRVGALHPPMPIPIHPGPVLPKLIMPPILTYPTDQENYLPSSSNPVQQVSTAPVSTFSIDVDTGSYSNSRRMLKMGQLPPSDAVREEAFINYFDYQYRAPTSTDVPFNVHSEIAPAPWDHHRQLLKIGIKGFEVDKAQLKAANLVFLLDVSGSMNAPDKLPLLKKSLTMLTKQLGRDDSVAIVVYAGAAGMVLDATAGNDHLAIINALDKLSAGGSTNGGQGIELAYQIAQKQFIQGGINRVILATDGDFNVGMQSIDKLKQLVAAKRKTGIALTTLGFGQGNYNDGLMEQLANIGNGQHAYIDTIQEARKVLVDELSSSMQIIAKDVKIQVEFNPKWVAEYRLIGYQNRLLAAEDFNNDQVDAAELGAGHTVTALYEITLANSTAKQIDDLRYQASAPKATEPKTTEHDETELAFVKLRYKQPDTDQSLMVQQAISASSRIDTLESASQDFQFAAAVAGFAQLLKGAKYTGQWQYQACIELAQANKGADPFGYRSEFIQLVQNAATLQ
ncbi:vWA domain-containing protein [Pseudoalteromonas ulvae]|nr:VWA domain-containing protein [Pseudoalteromonas ulvae]